MCGYSKFIWQTNKSIWFNNFIYLLEWYVSLHFVVRFNTPNKKPYTYKHVWVWMQIKSRLRNSDFNFYDDINLLWTLSLHDARLPINSQRWLFILSHGWIKYCQYKWRLHCENDFNLANLSLLSIRLVWIARIQSKWVWIRRV